MKKRFTLLMTFLLIVLTTFAQLASRLVTINTALQYAKSYCNDSDGKYDYYKGVSKKSINGRSYYYIFVDQQPGAGWEHACKHLYISTTKVADNSMVLSEDGTRPYGNTDIEPLDVKDRYGSNSALKAKVAKLNTNAEEKNKFAGNTYAIILSGGMSKTANDIRYWNDCSFIYQTLRNRYGIPKKNIKVVMSDGTDPADDMTDENGEYSSSPLDLDDDGVADIEYSATKTNVTKAIKEMASTMKDEDHLFLYVVDHGGYDPQKKQSYICLWGDERLYPDELSGCLNTGDAGYVTVLMGQCYSGGFVNALKGNNRIIATACGEDELSYGCEDLPFDEFVYRWTSAINGYDVEGNKITAQTDTLPDGTQKPVTMVKAYEYARNHDMYTDGKFQYAAETPSLSYLNNSTAEDLAMDTIPPTVYLYIPHGNTGYVNPYYDSSKTVIRNPFIFWSSTDIWLRNQNDGFKSQQYEMPNITDEHATVYIYTRVKNRGVKVYPGKGTTLRTWWAESSVVLDEYAWKGYREDSLMGGEINYATIKDTIQPGGTYIKEFNYTFTEDRLEKAKRKGFNMCLLSFLSSKGGSPAMPVTDSGIAKAWATDRMGQKNQLKFKGFGELYDLVLMPPLLYPHEFSLVMATDNAYTSQSKANVEVSLSLPSGISDNTLLKGFRKDKQKLRYLTVNDSIAVIRGIQCKPTETAHLGITANLVADKDIISPEIRNLDIFVVDEATGEIMGGESVEITVSPRQKIVPEIDKTVLSDGNVRLTAENVNEKASYEWYDSEGRLVGTGTTLDVSSVASSSEYTLKVTAEKDNAINRTTVNVEKTPFVKNATVSRDVIDVKFSVPASNGMSARISSVDGNSPVVDYAIKEGATDISFNAPAASTKLYQLSVLLNGKIIETLKIKCE